MDLIGPRVRLRQWSEDDLDSLAGLNADPAVMEFFPQCLTREQSLQMLGRLRHRIHERGWGVWAVEVGGELAGFTGLTEPLFTAPFTPCVEILWRFRRGFWGKGLAAEAARVALLFAFDQLSLREVLAFTSERNERSQRLMQRLGMLHCPEERFDHPLLPAGHPLRRHVLYRIQKSPEVIFELKQQLGKWPVL